MSNRYVTDVPAEAKGYWAVLRRADSSRPWQVVDLLPAPDMGHGDLDADRLFSAARRRLRKFELALVDPRGVEQAYHCPPGR